jgi:Bacterial PH domain
VCERTVLRAWFVVALCWVGAIGSLVAFGAIAISGPGPNPGPIDYLTTIAFGVISSLLFLRATRMRVEVDDHGVTVCRIFTTVSIPWDELADVSVDYGGLRLMRSDGTVVTAGSMGKPSWASWFHRGDAADERVDLITYEMARHRPYARP